MVINTVGPWFTISGADLEYHIQLFKFLPIKDSIDFLQSVSYTQYIILNTQEYDTTVGMHNGDTEGGNTDTQLS